MAVSIAQPSLLESDNLDAPYPDRAPEAVLQDADRLTIHSGTSPRGTNCGGGQSLPPLTR